MAHMKIKNEFPSYNLLEILKDNRTLNLEDLYKFIILIEQKKKTLGVYEPDITDLLKKIASENNGRLILLEKKFKDDTGIISKILKKKNEAVYDLLRYTIQIPFESYIQDSKKIYDELITFGFKDIPKIQNRWQLGDGYQGINVILTNGIIFFELQFHTEESINIKETQHDMYKEFSTNKCNWSETEDDTEECKRLRLSLLYNERMINNPFSCYPEKCPPQSINDGLKEGNFPEMIKDFTF